MLAMMSCILSRRDSHGVDAAFASSRSQHLVSDSVVYGN